MQLSKLVFKAVSVLAITLLTACPRPTGSLSGEYYNDTVRGQGYTIKASLTWQFLSSNDGVNITEGSSEMALVLKSFSSQPPKLKSHLATLLAFSPKGDVLGRAQFPLSETSPGIYVLANPDEVDAWASKFAGLGALQVLLDSTDPGSPFQVSLYGAGAELASIIVGK